MREILELRCSSANRRVLEKGIPVSFLKFAQGVDGVWEFYIEGDGECPLPDCSEIPAVPVERANGQS